MFEGNEVFGTPGIFQRNERRMRGIPFSAGFRAFQPHEAAARLIKTFQHSLVPGLFQARDYAQAITDAYPETTLTDDHELRPANLISSTTTKAVRAVSLTSPFRGWIISAKSWLAANKTYTRHVISNRVE
jgi:hypothetical protein